MRNARALLVGLIAAGAISSCTSGSSGGLVVVPPDLLKADIAEGKYKQVHAVFLYDVGYVHFNPVDIGHSYFPSYVNSRFSRIKLLTRAATNGDRFGSQSVDHYGDLIEIKAFIEKPSGKRVQLKKSDIVSSILVKDVVPGANPPIDYKRTTMVFPGLDPNDIIEYQYTTRGLRLQWVFSKREAPVEYSKFMVARPPQRSIIQPLIIDRHSLQPEMKEEKGLITGMQGYLSLSRQAIYDVWTARNVPPIVPEIAMPQMAELASSVRVWQGSRKWDWNTLGTTYYKWFTHYGRPPSAVKNLTQKIIKGIADPRDRARAIYHWVKSNLVLLEYERLTAVPRVIEISTIEIADLLQEKNSTAEQAASLMWLMLNEAGITATLILTTPNHQSDAVEGLHDLYQFTTPILALDDGTFLDTTNRFSPFGFLTWTFEGRNALWCKGSTVSFRKLPVSSSKDNQRITKITGEIESSGDIKVRAKIRFTGQMALAFRYYFGPHQPKERQRRLRDLISYAANNAEIDKMKLINLDQIDKDLEILVSFHVPNYAEVMQDKLVVKLGAFIHHTGCPNLGSQNICPRPTSDKRVNPVRFLFKRYEEMDVSIKTPLGFQLQALPKGFRTREIEKDTAVGMQTSYGYEKGKLRVIRKFSTNHPELDSKGYQVFKPMIKRFQAQKDTLITLQLPKMD